MRVGFGSHEISHNLKLQKQRAEGEDVGKGFGKGKPKKRGSPSGFGGFYYPSPLLRFALCEKYYN